MTRIIKYISLLSLLLLASCKTESLPQGSLEVSGITNNTILIGPYEGNSAAFTIKSAYSWEIPEQEGFRCVPDHGEEGTFRISIFSKQASTSISRTELKGFAIYVKSTRFVGIHVYQDPMVTVFDAYDPLYVEALHGVPSEMRFKSQAETLEIVPSGDITAELTGSASASVEAVKDNTTTSQVKLGKIRFRADGVMLDGEVPVIQRSALVMERERIELSGFEGAQFRTPVRSPFDLKVSVSGNSFTASLDEQKTLTVRASQANETKSLKKLGTLTVSVDGVDSCSQKIEIWQKPHYCDQTLMVYFLGTMLRSYYEQNAKDILLGIDRDMLSFSRVLIFMQDTNAEGVIWECVYNPETGLTELELAKEMTLSMPYSSSTMESVLKEMTSYASADRYGLVISSHGLGWIPKNRVSQNGANRSSMWRKVEEADVTKHIGDTAQTQLDTWEVASAIEFLDVNLEYLIMDACFMGNIESIYDLRHCAHWYMGSPCEIMGSGFPYSRMLKYLLVKGGGYDLDSAAKEYVDSYLTASRQSACIAVTDCTLVDELAEAVKEVNAAGIKPYDPKNIQTYEGLGSYSNPNHAFYDLEDLVIQTCADEKVTEKFLEVMGRAVLSRYHTDEFYSAYNGRMNPITHYGGISTSAIAPEYSPGPWCDTAWYKATH